MAELYVLNTANRASPSDDDAVASALDKALTLAPEYERGLAAFSRQLEKCYVELDCDHAKMKSLRSEVMRSGVLYKELHLQATKRFITDLADWVGNYVDLSFEEFQEALDIICDDAAKYTEQAELVTSLHHALYNDCKTLGASARTTVEALRLEQEGHQVVQGGLRAKATRHQDKGENGLVIAGIATFAGLALAPVTGGLSLAVSTPVAAAAGTYMNHHEKKEAAAWSSALAAGKNAENAAAAAELIAGPMSTSINMFTMAMASLSTFFQAVSNEVQAFQARSVDASKLRSKEQQEMELHELNKRLKLHHLRMKTPAKNLVLLCKGFNARVPQLEQDLQRLAARETTNAASYIQVWLQQKQLRLEGANKSNFLQTCCKALPAAGGR